MGPFGGGNLGDAAIQQSMIQHIRAYYPDAQIYGFSLIPEDTEARHGIPCYPIGRPSEMFWEQRGGKTSLLRRKINSLLTHENAFVRNVGRWMLRAPMELGLLVNAYQNLRGFTKFIVSGGGQLDDYWGGAWSHPYTLLKFVTMARLRGAKVFIVSVGAGPIDSRLSWWFIRSALNFASYRSYRDEPSKAFLAKRGFVRGDPVYPDLAHSLQVSFDLCCGRDRDGHSNGEEQSGSGPMHVVGIGPMAYFDPRVWPERDQAVYMNYLGKLASFCAYLIHQGSTIRLFPGEALHDREVIADLLQLIEKEIGPKLEGLVFAEPVNTVDELMAQLSKVETVVASRFHGVLLAQLLNKPLVALSYHPKVDALMEDTGQSAYCLPIDRFEVQALIERFETLEKNTQLVKYQVGRKVSEYRTALDKQYEHIFGDRRS